VLLGARNAYRTEQVSFEIGFEGGVGVDRSKMRSEGVPNRGASMPKTKRGKSIKSLNQNWVKLERASFQLRAEIHYCTQPVNHT